MTKLIKQIMIPSGSLRIFGLGVLAQIILYPISIAVIVRFNNHPVIEPIIGGVMMIMFFMPLLGIIGIIIGIKCYRRRIRRLLPCFGIVMNALWLTLLAAACYLVFVMRVTV